MDSVGFRQILISIMFRFTLCRSPELTITSDHPVRLNIYLWYHVYFNVCRIRSMYSSLTSQVRTPSSFKYPPKWVLKYETRNQPGFIITHPSLSLFSFRFVPNPPHFIKPFKSLHIHQTLLILFFVFLPPSLSSGFSPSDPSLLLADTSTMMSPI